MSLSLTRAARAPDTDSAPLEIGFATGECSLGTILVARTRRGVCSILLGDAVETLTRDLGRRFPTARVSRDAETDAMLEAVSRLIESPGLELYLPLDPRGTPFQLEVWQALREIPAGTTASYSEVARHIGAPASARAVAQACAANAMAVAIPCHRVVRADGSLSGYRWGVERKGELLAREAQA